VTISIHRQMAFLAGLWYSRTDSNIIIDYRVDVCEFTVESLKRITGDYKITEPSVETLAGAFLSRWADCFAIWILFEPELYKRLECRKGKKLRPFICGDDFWIPGTEKETLEDIERCKPRKAARHELKHWVKNRMECIGVTGIPSPHKRQYWEKLRPTLTRDNLQKLSAAIDRRTRCRIQEMEQD